MRDFSAETSRLTHGVLHGFHVVIHVGRGVPAVLPHQLDDGAAHDGAVGETGHLLRLLRRGDAEAHGAGDGTGLPHQLHHGPDVRGDLAAGAGDTHGGDDVQEAAGLPGDHGDAVLGGGGHQGDQIQAVPLADGLELLLLLKGHVRQDEAVDANAGAGGDEPLRAVGEHHVGVGHEHHGDGDIFPQLPDHVEDLIRGNAAGQCPDVGRLDDGTLGGGVREGDAQLNEIRSGPDSLPDHPDGGLQVRVAAGDEGDERLAVGKGLCNVTHGDSPLCTGRWRRSPCRPGRKC